VYSRDTLVLLQHLLDQGLGKRAIAKQLGVSRRTVHHWIATGQLTRVVETEGTRTSAPRPQKLDRFKPLIHERLAAYPALSAERLFAECRSAGYTGGTTRLRDYVARVRPRAAPEPIIRFETAPGLQAQFDFAEVKLPWGKRYAVLVVLGYSRQLYVEFVPRQTALAVMQSLERAFAAFGGVPAEILFDQLKAVIIEDQRPDGGTLLANVEFGRFAAHWGFRIRACRPYRAQTKGKVERPVSYVRSSFLYGREFLGDADLADQCTRWLADVANVRRHGTTGERPVERFRRDEQAALQPLAARPYRSLVLLPPRAEAATTRTVPHVAVERRALAQYGALLAEEAS
jgi:transposase